MKSIVIAIVLSTLIAMVSIAAAVDFQFDRLNEPLVTSTGNDLYYAEQSRSGSLIHTINANVIGISHIGFAAKDPHNPHHTIAIGRMETVGNFQIEKTIEILSDCNQGSSGMLLGCP